MVQAYIQSTIIITTTEVMTLGEYFLMSQALQLTVQMYYLTHFLKYSKGYERLIIWFYRVECFRHKSPTTCSRRLPARKSEQGLAFKSLTLLCVLEGGYTFY